MPLHSRTPSYLASFKSRLVLPFWYRLTQVFLEKWLLNGCSTSSSSSSSGCILVCKRRPCCGVRAERCGHRRRRTVTQTSPSRRSSLPDCEAAHSQSRQWWPRSTSPSTSTRTNNTRLETWQCRGIWPLSGKCQGIDQIWGKSQGNARGNFAAENCLLLISSLGLLVFSRLLWALHHPFTKICQLIKWYWTFLV